MTSTFPPSLRSWLHFQKWIYLIPIIFFHSNENLTQVNDDSVIQKNFLYPIIISWMKWMNFSGWSIVFLYSFIFGFFGMSQKTRIRILGLIVTGSVAIPIIYDYESWFYWWDIHTFLFCIWAPFLFFGVNLRLWFYCFIFWTSLHLIYSLSGSSFIHQILGPTFTGGCTEGLKMSWPLYKASLLSVGFLGLGIMYRHWPWIQNRWISVFLTALLLIIPAETSYRLNTPIGDALYCYLTQASIFYCLHVVVFSLWFIHLSFLSPWPRWLNFLLKSVWIKHFGLAYIYQAIYFGVLSHWSSFFENTPGALDLSVMMCFVSAELLYLAHKWFCSNFRLNARAT